MATQNHPERVMATENGSENSRLWNLYAIRGYAAIVARKHNLATPLDDLNSLSDEEVLVRLQLVRDLAHLPPG